MNNLLINIKKKIDILEEQVIQKNFDDINYLLFDEHLFDTTKKTHNGFFYLDKIKRTYQTLSESMESNDADKIAFFSELLINQIAALTRELSTHHLRSKEPEIIYESLSEKHSRHLDYLRRLEEMKYEFELSSDSLDYQKMATLDNRIYRCEQAIKHIEKQMEDDS